MINDRSYLLEYIDSQLESLTRRPAMWGPDIAVELQFTLLLEVKSVLLRPTFDREHPRAVRDALAEFISEKLHDSLAIPLSARLAEIGRASDLPTILAEFRQRLEAEMHADNPFESYDVAVVLQLTKDVGAPAAASVGGYIEEIRRALRGTLRQNSQGRMSRELEAVTDFALPDIQIRKGNGKPGSVVIPFEKRNVTQVVAPGILSAEDALRSAFGQIVATLDWAAGTTPVSDLTALLTDPFRREKVATQALRLFPRGEDIESVDIGGRMLARPAPVRLERRFQSRVNEIRTEGYASTPFDTSGGVRQLDLDDGSFRLSIPARGGVRLRCELLNWELLPKVQQALGQTARIVGDELRPGLRKPFVLVRDVIVESGGDEDDETELN